MGYLPLNYEQINMIAGLIRPSCVKSYNNKTFNFWERALFQRALSVIDFTLPENWTGSIKDLFEFCMFAQGRVAVFESDDYGITFQPCALTGFDWYYRPTNAIVTNPALKSESLDMKIGSEGDCEILKLTPDFYPVWDVLEYYAEKLSTLDNAINMSLINNKYAFMLAAKNKGAAEALKKMLDKVNKGEPAVIVDQRVQDDPNSKTQPWQILDRGNLKESYMTTDQLADFRTILHNFDTEIGIPTLPIEKKERMIDAEANSLSTDATSRSRVWVETFNSSAIAVNKHFGLNISARLNYEKEGLDDGDTSIDRDV